MNVLRSGANTNAARGPPATPPNLLQNPRLVDENTPLTPPNSLQNPYLVDKMGRFVRILASPIRPQLKRSPSGRALLIYGGQPSERFSRAARNAANAPPYQRPLAPPAAVRRSAGNRNRRPQRAPMVSSALTRVRWLRGFRTQRETLLTEADLYATEARLPDAATTGHPDHQCGLCSHIQSHPILSRCGHEHCYVCIRRWLEQSWKCPTCEALITAAPKENPDRELAIALDHPDFVDPSIVSFSWDGLRFPNHPRRRQYPDVLDSP